MAESGAPRATFLGPETKVDWNAPSSSADTGQTMSLSMIWTKKRSGFEVRETASSACDTNRSTPTGVSAPSSPHKHGHSPSHHATPVVARNSTIRIPITT
jgi:hypothetical protein